MSFTTLNTKLFLTWALHAGEMSASCTGHYVTRDRAPIEQEGWLGSRVDLYSLQKNKLPMPRIELRFLGHASLTLVTKWTMLSRSRQRTTEIYNHVYKQKFAHTGQEFPAHLGHNWNAQWELSSWHSPDNILFHAVILTMALKAKRVSFHSQNSIIKRYYFFTTIAKNN